MTPSEIAAWLGAAVSLLTLLSGIFKFGQLSLKVDTMWSFQMRRAESEAIQLGVATRNSPIVVTAEAKAWMKPLIGPIKDFYRKLGRNLTDRELALEIERRFGDRIRDEVCIPHGMDHGACLIIALQAAKEA